MMTTNKAYENGITKEEFVKEMKKHQAMDAFIGGTYGSAESTRACSVGYGIKSIVAIKKLGSKKIEYNDHAFLAEQLGMPEWLQRLQDNLFEGITNKRQKTWPIEFAESINPGADLEKAKTPFIIFILKNCIESMDSCVFDKDNNPEVVKAIAGSKAAVLEMIRCHQENLDLSATAAESAAWSAAASASAAWSAWSALSARSAESEKYADKLLEILREIKS